MKLNNKLLRILQCKPITTPIRELYKTYNTLLITDLHKQQLLLFVHKFIYQWCEQDQILKTKTKTKTKTRTTRPRPRPRWRPEWQDQDRYIVPRLFVQYTYCSSSKQFPFSVFKRLLYLTYSKFDIIILTIVTTEMHACSLRINTPHICYA